MKRLPITISLLWLCCLTVFSQSQLHFVTYDEEDGVPSSHITQMLQDKHGFMWFSTWNGICRFDGYEFQTFKPMAGDGCHMTNDRIRDIALRPNGEMICKVEDDEYYIFDTHQYRFCDIAQEEVKQAEEDIKRYRQSKSAKGRVELQGALFCLDDWQGNLWVLRNGKIGLCLTDVQPPQRLPIEPKAEVKCLFKDSKNRYWLTTREDASVRIYDADMQLVGYLAADGSVRKEYTSFGSAIYCICETRDGTLWLGSKPNGLFRMRETASGNFSISRPEDMMQQDVYSMVEDRFGRLWVATMRNGLFFTENCQTDAPTFHAPQHYPKDSGQRVRHLHITRGGLLLAAATDGLMVAKLERNASDIRFLHHQREADRVESLSSSATMDILENDHGKVFVSTESGGVNMVDERELLNTQPMFMHLNTATHQLPSDISLSLARMDDGKMMVVGSHLVTILDTLGQGRVLDARYFHADFRFCDARPVSFGNGQWVFGLYDGAFVTSTEQMLRKSYCPPLVLTHIAVSGRKSEGYTRWDAEELDTLTLQPHERTVTVHFAALDFSAPNHISYAFRLSEKQMGDNTHWNYVGHNRSATLLDMDPGRYLLEIRSTSANGEWQQNMRVLTIEVLPTFWEAWYGQLLIVLLITVVILIIVYTLLYIRRIRRKHRETLEAYLALIEVNDSQQPTVENQQPVTEDPVLQRVMKFIEENISNADVGVGDMAAAAAVSRSGLQRKLKQTMGITPQELLSEARMKHACQLLRQTDKTIAEVAYSCGFNDPKYFSRTFKQSVGQSPSEYKNASN